MKEIIKEFELNKLGDELIKLIKNRTNIFTPLTIIVPNNKLQQWFKTYWLKTQNEILMNVNFETIDQSLLKLIDTKESFRLLTKEQLKSLIIKFLAIKDNITYPKEINDYLYNKDQTINQIKLYDLANKLSELFTTYEQEQINITGWEKELYDQVLENALKYNLSTLSYIYNKEQKLQVSLTPLYFFGFTYLTPLQEKIITNYANNSSVVLLKLTEDKEYKKEYMITTAPSKLREIEALHSKISTLLKEKDVELSDFLVLAPNISLYEGVIPRVFNQDNESFPSIPYVINDRKKIETNVSLGLKKLFEILNKKFYTRLDFFNLINNQDIKQSRNITEEDIINWSNTIIDINVYRNRNNQDDWDYAKKRILCSKISNINDINNNIIELNNQSYLPYSTIGIDDESIVRFVKIIDDLKSWLELTNKIKYISQENILLVKNELEKWFSIKDDNGFETNHYFQNIIKDLDFWYYNEIPSESIPLSTLFYMLIDSSKVTKINAGDYFVKGITFADFDELAVLSAKYIFFLNASSKELPIQVVKSELDLREGNISNNEQTEKAFFIQYQNATSKFFISYINKDLKTDEEFYPSSFILKLKERLNVKEEEISLDETRTWDQLFTKKEYKNKDYFLGLLSTNNSTEEQSVLINETELLKKVRVKDMATFLEEPLKYKANYLFGRGDSLDDELRDEFEPFSLDNITKSILIKKVCIDALINDLDVDLKSDFNNLKIRFNLEHKLPNINKLFNEESFSNVIIECENIITHIREKTNNNFEICKLADLTFTNQKTTWVLSCDQEICKSVDGLNRTYFQFKKIKDKPSEHDYLYLYVYSLMDIAGSLDNTYHITLNRGTTKTFTITPLQANSLLNKIYTAMNDYSDNVYLPIDIFNNKKITSLYELIENLIAQDGSPWNYFEDKKLFDYEQDLGYTNENFNEKYKQKKKEHAELIIYFTLDEDGGGNNE